MADDFVLSRYQQANSYPQMTEEGIGIEPQRLSSEEFHARAWAVVQPLFEQAKENARDVYKHLQGTESDRVSNDVRRIVQAAAFGRVEGLFVARDEQQWGTFDEESGEVELHESSSQGIGIFWREQPCRPWSTRAGYSSSIGPTCPMPVPWRQCLVGRHCQLACRSLQGAMSR